MAEARRSWWRRQWVKWVASAMLALLIVAAVLVELALRRAEPFLRARLIAELEDRFHARVELDRFHVSLVKGLWAEGEGLRIWPPAHVAGVGVPEGQGEPLIRLNEFRFHAPLHYAPGKPIHISLVNLKGLKIDLPPRSHFEHAMETDAGASEDAGKAKSAIAEAVSFEVERMECTGAELILETGTPGKLPLDFQIAHLKLTNISSGEAKLKDEDSAHRTIGFEAELTNPRPKGTITTKGSFGAFPTADLGENPIRGNYRFEHADLSSFKGIAGILSSTGHYEGTLRSLAVDGQTETPDFRLTKFGNELPLTTVFHAKVDGTNGDTWLDPVDATLGRSHFSATGQIVRVKSDEGDGPPHIIGHDVDLKVDVDNARIEDFLRLVNHSEHVLMSGNVAARAALHIPPGPAPVHERLTLDGRFLLDDALFTSEKVQERIAELSLRGQGHPDDVKTTDPSSILSQIQSSFEMKGGVITLPALEYTVPGAKIELKGTYKLENGALDFTGMAKLEATVSKIVGGWKGLLLTPADPFFKKDGAGTEVPVRIEGTREAPEIGIDFKNMKLEKKPTE